MTKFQPTPRRFRDDVALELIELRGTFRLMRSALRRFDRALTHCDEGTHRAQRSLRKAQVLEDQLALWEPQMGDRRMEVAS